MISQVEELTDECIKRFGDAMSGIIHYGSGSRKQDGPFSDQDLIMTVKDYDLHILTELRHILKRVAFLIDLPVIFESELPKNVNDFRIINHGCYFLEILKRGNTLHGKNIFLEMPHPSEDAIRKSLFEKITEYAQFFRRNFIESNRERSLSSNYQLNRRLVKAAHDLLWLAGVQCYEDELFMETLKREMPSIFNDDEWLLLNQLISPEQAQILSINLSDDFSQARFMIMEKIYSVARRLIIH